VEGVEIFFLREYPGKRVYRGVMLYIHTYICTYFKEHDNDYRAFITLLFFNVDHFYYYYSLHTWICYIVLLLVTLFSQSFAFLFVSSCSPMHSHGCIR
jgi:hypothetical protein